MTSRLDYRNSVLQGVTGCNLERLQRTQNCLVGVVARSRPFAHAPPLLQALHCFLIKFRTHFKVTPLTFKALNTGQPLLFLLLLLLLLLSVVVVIVLYWGVGVNFYVIRQNTLFLFVLCWSRDTNARGASLATCAGAHYIQRAAVLIQDCSQHCARSLHRSAVRSHPWKEPSVSIKTFTVSTKGQNSTVWRYKFLQCSTKTGTSCLMP